MSQSNEIGVLAELAEAVANALVDRPQRCGHSSDPMCCPHGNFPTLAEFFDPDEDPSVCGQDDGRGACGRPAGHTNPGIHAVPIGGGSDPVRDPAVWFLFGEDVETPGFQTQRLARPGGGEG
ncbi:MAG: hypothetical protein HOV97_05340 [Nonomuraea sp.]|nr:hypothetical protein [Nonomuraea sp.]